MSLVIGDNFSYQGKNPLDKRMLFDTIADMKVYSENYLPDLYITFNKEDDKMYIFNRDNEVDAVTGKWRELDAGLFSTTELDVSKIKDGKIIYYEGDNPFYLKGFYLCLDRTVKGGFFGKGGLDGEDFTFCCFDDDSQVFVAGPMDMDGGWCKLGLRCYVKDGDTDVYYEDFLVHHDGGVGPYTLPDYVIANDMWDSDFVSEYKEELHVKAWKYIDNKEKNMDGEILSATIPDYLERVLGYNENSGITYYVGNYTKDGGYAFENDDGGKVTIFQENPADGIKCTFPWGYDIDMAEIEAVGTLERDNANSRYIVKEYFDYDNTLYIPFDATGWYAGEINCVGFIYTVGDINLRDLTDTDIFGPQNNQVLTYDFSSEKWKPKDPQYSSYNQLNNQIIASSPVVSGKACNVLSRGPLPVGYHMPSVDEWSYVRNGLTVAEARQYLHMPSCGSLNESGTYTTSETCRWLRGKSVTGKFFVAVDAASGSDQGMAWSTRNSGFSYAIRGMRDEAIIPDETWTETLSGKVWENAELGLITFKYTNTRTQDVTYFTFMDKDWGATEVWNSGDALTTANTGTLHQWGNNWGSRINVSYTPTEQYDASMNGYSNPIYSENKYISVDNSWMKTINPSVWGADVTDEETIAFTVDMDKIKCPAGSEELSTLEDVELTNPTEGQVLSFNGTSEKWENKGMMVEDLGNYNEYANRVEEQYMVLKRNITTQKWEKLPENSMQDKSGIYSFNDFETAGKYWLNSCTILDLHPAMLNLDGGGKVHGVLEVFESYAYNQTSTSTDGIIFQRFTTTNNGRCIVFTRRKAFGHNGEWGDWIAEKTNRQSVNRGKTYAFFGGSVCYNWNPFVVSDTGYAIEEILGVNSIRKRAISGAGWVAGNKIDNQITAELAEANPADVWVFWSSTNDHTAQAPIGDLDHKTDTTTVIGAMCDAIERVRTAQPTANILMTTPIRRFNNESGWNPYYDDGTTIPFYKYAEAVYTVANYYGIPVFDLWNNSGIDIKNYTTYMSDTIHPNATGYALFSRELCKFCADGHTGNSMPVNVKYTAGDGININNQQISVDTSTATISGLGAGVFSTNVQDAIREISNRDNYSSNAVRTGIWISGEEVYKKTFMGNTLTTNQEVLEIDVSDLDIGTLLGYEGVVKGYNAEQDKYYDYIIGTTGATFGDVMEQTDAWYRKSDKKMVIRVQSDTGNQLGKPFYLTIKYIMN